MAPPRCMRIHAEICLPHQDSGSSDESQSFLVMMPPNPQPFLFSTTQTCGDTYFFSFTKLILRQPFSTSTRNLVLYQHLLFKQYNISQFSQQRNWGKEFTKKSLERNVQKHMALISSNFRLTITSIHSFIHSVFCLTTGPKPPIKRFLHIVRSRASSLK